MTRLGSIDRELFAVAVSTFGDLDSAASSWLTGPAFERGGRVPVEVSRANAGSAAVITLLKRISGLAGRS